MKAWDRLRHHVISYYIICTRIFVSLKKTLFQAQMHKGKPVVMNFRRYFLFFKHPKSVPRQNNIVFPFYWYADSNFLATIFFFFFFLLRLSTWISTPNPCLLYVQDLIFSPQVTLKNQAFRKWELSTALRPIALLVSACSYGLQLVFRGDSLYIKKKMNSGMHWKEWLIFDLVFLSIL